MKEYKFRVKTKQIYSYLYLYLIILFTEDNILTILQATKADSGAYRCEAWNAYSKSSSSVTLAVDGMYQ